MNRKTAHTAKARCPTARFNGERRIVGVSRLGRAEEDAARFNVDLASAHSVVREFNNAVTRLFEGNAFGHGLGKCQIEIGLHFIVGKAEHRTIVFVSRRNEHRRTFSADSVDVRSRQCDIVAKRERAVGEARCGTLEIESSSVAIESNSTGVLNLIAVIVVLRREVIPNFERRSLFCMERITRIFSDGHAARVLVVSHVVDVDRRVVREHQLTFAEERAIDDGSPVRELEAAHLAQAGLFAPGVEIECATFRNRNAAGRRFSRFVHERAAGIHRDGGSRAKRAALADREDGLSAIRADRRFAVIRVITRERQFARHKRKIPGALDVGAKDRGIVAIGQRRVIVGARQTQRLAAVDVDCRKLIGETEAVLLFPSRDREPEVIGAGCNCSAVVSDGDIGCERT